jgi:hypothetical protein
LGHAGASLAAAGVTATVVTWPQAGHVERTASPAIAKLAAASS